MQDFRTGVQFGEFHTFKDWGLYNHTYPDVGMPEPKIEMVEIPGSNTVIDLTQALSQEVKYKPRPMKFEFTKIAPKEQWRELYSELANKLNGKRMKITLDDDLDHYYIARLTVKPLKVGKSENFIIEVTGKGDPFKYDQQTTDEAWLWDIFNFETGVIRGYKNITIPREITVIGSEQPVTPTFITTGAAQLQIGSQTFNLAAGENTNYDIRIQPGEQTLKFTGAPGKVTIKFRGASL